MSGPRTLGPYELLRVLDAGGMGKVYLAREREGESAGRMVVVKTIRSEFERAPEHMASFQREARLLAHLRHPNIVQLYDAGRVGHRLYMAMEYLEGLDLAKVLRLLRTRERRLPLPVVLHIGTQVALALDAAHACEFEPGKSARLVHRDLSPHNIFLLYGGGVKLLDFGLARAYGEDGTTRTGMVKGKFRYLAPEQARGEALDQRVDIFTLGLVMHEMLTGRRAYEQHGDVDVLRAAMVGGFSRLRDLPEGALLPPLLVEAVDRAVETDRDTRWGSAIALAEALQHAAAESAQAVDPLSLRQFMGELRESVERDPPPSHAPLGDDEADEFSVEAPAGAASGPLAPDPPQPASAPSAGEGAATAPALPSGGPSSPPAVAAAVAAPARRDLRRLGPLAAGLFLVGLLAALSVMLRTSSIGIAAPGATATSSPVPAADSAPEPAPVPARVPSASASTDPQPGEVPSARPPTPKSGARGGGSDRPAPPPHPSRHLVRPKRGVGTGVVADYP